MTSENPLPDAAQVGREPCTICGGKGWYFIGGWPVRCGQCLQRAALLKRQQRKPKAAPQRERK